MATETRKKVLIVDDEPGVRLTLAANLELCGYDVVEAADGLEAVEAVRKERFDLILSDIRMPRLDGVSAFLECQRLQPGVQTVFMTGFEVEELGARALSHGAYTVLHKPLHLDVLLQIIEMAVRDPMILVVDDAPSFGLTVVGALESAGLRARCVSDGAKALEVIQSEIIDVCVLDLVMPDMDGVETLRRIREENDEILVIAVTGHQQSDLIRQIMGAGALKCFQKPFDMEALIQAVGRARGRQWSAAPA